MLKKLLECKNSLALDVDFIYKIETKDHYTNSPTITLGWVCKVKGEKYGDFIYLKDGEEKDIDDILIVLKQQIIDTVNKLNLKK